MILEGEGRFFGGFEAVTGGEAIVIDFAPDIGGIVVGFGIAGIYFETEDFLGGGESAFKGRGTEGFALLQGTKEQIGVREVAADAVEPGEIAIGFHKHGPEGSGPFPLGGEGVGNEGVLGAGEGAGDNLAGEVRLEG